MNSQQEMSVSNRKNSTSQTILPDGTRVKEYIVEETHPDGSRTITTTQVKTNKVARTLPDGSKVIEDVSNTTTTTKQCPAQPAQEDLVQQAVNGFGTFMDLFTPTKKSEAKEAKTTNMNAKQGRMDDDDGISTLGADMTVDGRWSVQSTNDYHQMGIRRQGTGGGRSYTMSPQPGTQMDHMRGRQTPTNRTQKPASPFFPTTHPTSGGSVRSHHSDDIVYMNDNNGMPNNFGGNAMANNNNFMLYETDRCETQLPAFHKVPPPPDKKSLGRTIMRSLTPQRMTGVATSDNASAGSGQQRVRAATPNSFSKQPQQQRGRTSTRDDRHVLDPEVVDAIRMMHQRSKSPVGRGGAPLMQNFEEQQPMVPESSPYPNASYNNISSRQLAHESNNMAHPHDSSMQKIYGGINNQNYHSPGGDINRNQWDNDSIEERDDYPTVYGVTSMSVPPGLQKSRSASKLMKNRQQQQQQQQRGAATKTGKTSLFKKKRFPIILPPTIVKNGQSILTRDSFTTIVSPPKIAIHKANAIATSDRFVHFYSLTNNRWVQTTTVSLPNTHGLSLALFNDTAVIGVPYDRNSKGMLTGSAYIFERDNKTQTWYQVKKIVPKKVQEYSCVGFSVAICDNVVSVGVPELGASLSMNGACGCGSGSVYVYQRAEKFKWMLMSHLTMAQNNLDPRTLAPPGGLLVPPTSNFGTIVALSHKIMVVSNFFQPNEGEISETSLFVYEYDESLKQKWRLIQADLLSTEEQKRNFGSRIALTANGEGIFIGCHSDVNPTEILYFKRKNQVDVYGKRSFQLQQVINIQEKCDITQIHVDAQDNFIVGTLNSNRVYVYRKVHDLRTLEDQGWRLVAKVVDVNLDGERFGEHVVLSDDNILVGTANNVYSYSLEGWMTAKKKSSRSELIRSFSPMRFRTSA